MFVLSAFCCGLMNGIVLRFMVWLSWMSLWVVVMRFRFARWLMLGGCGWMWCCVVWVAIWGLVFSVLKVCICLFDFLVAAMLCLFVFCWDGM